MKRDFIRGCVKGGGTRTECRCVIRKFERAYTWREFKRFLRYVQKYDKFPRKARRIIRSATSELARR